MRGATPFGCKEPTSLEAFAWLNGLIRLSSLPLPPLTLQPNLWSSPVLKFTLYITVLGIIQHLRGNYIWMVPIYEIDFFATRAASPNVTYEKPVVYTSQQEQQLYA